MNISVWRNLFDFFFEFVFRFKKIKLETLRSFISEQDKKEIQFANLPKIHNTSLVFS
jgi:hypothetical protein